MELYEFLQSRRKKIALSQQEIANILSCSPQVVSKWEKGLSEPDISILSNYANALKCTTIDILLCNDGPLVEVENPPFNPLSFSLLLISLRKKSNLSQLEFGEKINISSQVISKWERGVSLPDLYQLKLIADFYNLDLNDFYYSKETPRIIAIEHIPIIEPSKIPIKRKNFITPITLVVVSLLTISSIVIPISLKKDNNNNNNNNNDDTSMPIEDTSSNSTDANTNIPTTELVSEIINIIEEDDVDFEYEGASYLDYYEPNGFYNSYPFLDKFQETPKFDNFNPPISYDKDKVGCAPHEFGEYKLVEAPTLESSGTYLRGCNHCYYAKFYHVPNLNHSFWNKTNDDTFSYYESICGKVIIKDKLDTNSPCNKVVFKNANGRINNFIEIKWLDKTPLDIQFVKCDTNELVDVNEELQFITNSDYLKIDSVLNDDGTYSYVPKFNAIFPHDQMEKMLIEVSLDYPFNNEEVPHLYIQVNPHNDYRELGYAPSDYVPNTDNLYQTVKEQGKIIDTINNYPIYEYNYDKYIFNIAKTFSNSSNVETFHDGTHITNNQEYMFKYTPIIARQIDNISNYPIDSKAIFLSDKLVTVSKDNPWKYSKEISGHYKCELDNLSVNYLSYKYGLGSTYSRRAELTDFLLANNYPWGYDIRTGKYYGIYSMDDYKNTESQYLITAEGFFDFNYTYDDSNYTYGYRPLFVTTYTYDL